MKYCHILERSKSKAISVGKINVAETIDLVFGKKAENMVGEGQNASYKNLIFLYKEKHLSDKKRIKFLQSQKNLS